LERTFGSPDSMSNTLPLNCFAIAALRLSVKSATGHLVALEALLSSQLDAMYFKNVSD
jgi:hypothetical protein